MSDRGSYTIDREGSVAVGISADAGPLKLAMAYAGGPRIRRQEVSGDSVVGSGSVITTTAGLVLRPVRRIVIVQPFVGGGMGVKWEAFKFPSGEDATRDRIFTIHASLGVDVAVSNFLLNAEFTAHASRKGGEQGFYDGFLFIGPKFLF